MRRAIFATISVALLSGGVAFADDASWSGYFDGTGSGVAQQTVHEDGGDYKGWLDITVWNMGTEAWGDFHLQIFSTGEDISNVGFLDSSDPLGQDPTSSQILGSWMIDNVVVGATMDLYYYSDPILPGEQATFSVYTSNPDQVSFFGIAFYPTPVPEPLSIVTVAIGGLFLIRRRLS